MDLMIAVQIAAMSSLLLSMGLVFWTTFDVWRSYRRVKAKSDEYERLLDAVISHMTGIQQADERLMQLIEAHKLKRKDHGHARK